jgi:hypothetical protein
MIEIRKIITTRETVFSELSVEANRPTTRAVGIAVIRNPFAGQFVEDLRPLFEAGAMLGERLMPELVKLLGGPAVSYGKGAIVGVAGEMEHGGACVHPMLGKGLGDLRQGRGGKVRGNIPRPGLDRRRQARPRRDGAALRARRDPRPGRNRSAEKKAAA